MIESRKTWNNPGLLKHLHDYRVPIENRQELIPAGGGQAEDGALDAILIIDPDGGLL